MFVEIVDNQELVGRVGKFLKLLRKDFPSAIFAHLTLSIKLTKFLDIYTDTGSFDLDAVGSGCWGDSISSCGDGFSVIRRAPRPKVI